ncbi:MAG: ribosomal protein S18-alanine N-acetyltransferase [Nitrospirota bacterium]|nr:MAG: ribosomal protein S18-alanine N-acetyltransferase [Nitrospirota bacterium]
MQYLSVREIRTEDLDTVTAIESLSFSRPWTRNMFYQEMGNPRSFIRVAELNGNIIGYICASFVLDEGHILDIAVNSLYRKKGIATVLVNDVLSNLRKFGIKRIFLEVRVSNRSALSFYEKIGFESIGSRKDYYRDPVEDAVTMSCDI